MMGQSPSCWIVAADCPSRLEESLLYYNLTSVDPV